jgi:Phospholipase_D-nuclease N-terminal
MILFETGGIVFVALILFWVWALFDCVATDASLCRNLPKGLWIILVLILPDIGSLLWLLLGRPERASWRPGSSDYSKPRRPVGLEDHPRYSATPGVTDRRSAELDAQLAEWEKERQSRAIEPPTKDRATLDAWEAELNRRELELRRRELEQRERELESRERDDG